RAHPITELMDSHVCRARDVLHDRRAALLHSHEPDLRQAMNRLPHDRSRHLELIGERTLRWKRRAHRELSFHDRFRELIKDAIGRVLATHDLELPSNTSHASRLTRPGRLVTKLVSGPHRRQLQDVVAWIIRTIMERKGVPNYLHYLLYFCSFQV